MISAKTLLGQKLSKLFWATVVFLSFRNYYHFYMSFYVSLVAISYLARNHYRHEIKHKLINFFCIRHSQLGAIRIYAKQALPSNRSKTISGMGWNWCCCLRWSQARPFRDPTEAKWGSTRSPTWTRPSIISPVRASSWFQLARKVHNFLFEARLTYYLKILDCTPFTWL